MIFALVVLVVFALLVFGWGLCAAAADGERAMGRREPDSPNDWPTP